MGSSQQKLIMVKKIYIFIAIQMFVVGYIYRAAFAPIADVLEEYLNTTSTGLGLASSVIYFGYASMQIPYGLALQKVHPQFILFCCCCGLGITSFLFPFSTNTLTATIINFISGVFIAPSFIIHLNLTMQVLGNKYVGLIVGFNLLESYSVTLGSTILQAYIYQTYNNWTYSFYFVSSFCIVTAIILFSLMIYENILKNSDRNTGNIDNYMELKQTHHNDKTPLIKLSDTDNSNQYSFFSSIIFVNCSSKKESIVNGNQLSLCKALLAAASNYLNYVNGLYGFGLITCLLSFNGLWLISYMMIKFDYSRELSSFISGTFFVSTGIGAVIYGRLALKLKKRTPLMISGVLLSTASIYIIYCDDDTPIYVILILNLISGFGCGAQPVLFSLIKEYNEYYNCTVVATGFTNTLVTCTGFITQFLMGDLLDIHWESRGGNDFDGNDRNYTVADYDFAFTVIPVSIGLAFVMAIVAKETNSEIVDHSKGTLCSKNCNKICCKC